MDIIENAQAVLRYTVGMDSKAFEEDRKTYDAVERCLERISEAAAKLGEQAEILVPVSRGVTFGHSETVYGTSTTIAAKTAFGRLFRLISHP
jgi:hypothetical protein